MNLQLFLCDREIDLDKKFIFPFNKSFENLENPTQIIVDYTKSINIPMTRNNNRILGSIYRIDRVISGRDSQGIGMYLDPSKKIPMKLIYNGDVLLDGYAKFVSSNNSSKGKYYTLNLYGIIGLIFQKLKDVVISESQLTEDQKQESDGGQKYILQDYCTDLRLNNSYIKDSWEHDNHLTGNPAEHHYPDYDIIGFAPSYRGYYGDFKSDQIYSVQENKTQNLIESTIHFMTLSCEKYYSDQGLPPAEAKAQAEALVKALRPEDLIKDGYKDYQMNQYRSYHLKPYVYFEKLFYMYANKCKELTGYDIKLDPSWFNDNNPYWANLCYMLDFLENKGTEASKDINIFNYLQAPSSFEETDDRKAYSQKLIINKVSDISIDGIGNVILPPMILSLYSQLRDPRASNDFMEYKLNPDVCVNFKISLYDDYQGNSTHVGTALFWSTANPLGEKYKLNPNQEFTNAPFVQHSCNNDPIIPQAYPSPDSVAPSDHLYERWDHFSIPSINFSRDYVFKGNPRIAIECQTITSGETYEDGIYLYKYLIRGYSPFHAHKPPVNNSIQFRLQFPGASVKSSYKTNAIVSLKYLYFKEEPLFNVILQYSKMFRLIWNPDYLNKTIEILTPSTYFKKYKVINWDDKVDRSKDYIIEPIAFPDKYVKFNYEDVDGFRYSGYKEKYGLNYGEKRISTNYDFNTEEKKLFDKIFPSSVSSKTFVNMDSFSNYTPDSKINYIIDNKAVIDAEDEDEESSISIYNWYFRLPNTTQNSALTDDVTYMINNDESCYIRPGRASIPEYIITSAYPLFNIAFPSQNGMFGCVFNTPQEDYTSDKLPTQLIGRCIYDQIWKGYLDERYNVQNKKLTCYLYLTSLDFQKFKYNNFVTIDGQLFMVNKIFDYDISNIGSTKVELIQVTNPKQYASGATF